jgi:AcrR family transcriptional regulator
LFATRGFEATRTADIARTAGCAEGLIHRYYGSKRGLLLSILETSRLLPEESPDASRPDSPLEDMFLSRLSVELENVWHRRDSLKILLTQTINPAFGTKAFEHTLSQRVSTLLTRLESNAKFMDLPADQKAILANGIDALSFTFGFVRPCIYRQSRRESRLLAYEAGKNMLRGVMNGVDGCAGLP